MLVTPGLRLGRYEILSKLGEGGMGVVYKALDLDLKRPVAIKILPVESVRDNKRKQRFIQEARAASALNHPGIVTIYAIAKQDELDYIAMEFIDGSTLADVLLRRKLSLKDILTYAVQAAHAIAKAHAAGIVHRDLKPSNLMITHEGLVKVLDFGLAKLLVPEEPDLDSAAETLTAPNDAFETAAGTVVGTVAYMSPEQTEGRTVDARSDIFSFGVVLYEMVTGVRAFRGSSPAQTLAAVVNMEPAPPSQLRADLPGDFERIILRCLRKDPARRYQIMADVAVELDDVKTESGTRLASAATRTSTSSKRWLATAGAMLIAAIGTGAWWLWPERRTSPTLGDIEFLTSFANDERTPSISPDGNQVAFSWPGEKGDNEDIYTIPVGAGSPLQLTTNPAPDQSPAWSPDGSQLAFVRVGAAERAIYVTAPVPNAEKRIGSVVPSRLDLGQAYPTQVSWFPDRRRLLVSDSAPDGRMQGLVAMNMNGDKTPVIWDELPNGSYRSPAVSPDGRWLAYARCVAAISCEMYVAEVTQDLKIRGDARPLTPIRAISSGVAWAADSKSVIYGWQRDYLSYLWRARLDGSEPERIDLAGDRAFRPSVSARAGLLVYEQNKLNSDIWRFTPPGQHEMFVSSSQFDWSPQFSPDGTRVAFESNRRGRLQIWTANADGSNQRPLTEPIGVVGSGSPRWSPDGRWIAYDEHLPNGLRGVFVIAAEGGARREIATGAIPRWSQDGQIIYFNRENGIWRIPSTGGKEEQIVPVGNGGDESADGASLYYRKVTTPGVLFAVPRMGGAEREVLSSPGLAGPAVVPVADGIYFHTTVPGSPTSREIRFFDFATRQTRRVFSIETRDGTAFAVSPDRRTVLYSKTSPDASVDIALIRNFH